VLASAHCKLGVHVMKNINARSAIHAMSACNRQSCSLSVLSCCREVSCWSAAMKQRAALHKASHVRLYKHCIIYVSLFRNADSVVKNRKDENRIYKKVTKHTKIKLNISE